jgi:hypothetical protein
LNYPELKQKKIIFFSEPGFNFQISTVTFNLQANADNTQIQGDFGNGTQVDKTIGTLENEVSDILVGSKTIKVMVQGSFL